MKNEKTFYALMIVFVVLMIGLYGSIIGEFLLFGTTTTEITSTTQTDKGTLISHTSFSVPKNLPQYSDILYKFDISNPNSENMTLSIQPIVTIQHKIIYEGQIIEKIIEPNQKFEHTFILPFDEPGYPTVYVNLKSNVVESKKISFSKESFNVVTPERYDELNDQKLYYSLLWIIAIPVVISTIKNLKDLFGKQSHDF